MEDLGLNSDIINKARDDGYAMGFTAGQESERGIQNELNKRYVAVFAVTFFLMLLVLAVGSWVHLFG